MRGSVAAGGLHRYKQHNMNQYTIKSCILVLYSYQTQSCPSCDEDLYSSDEYYDEQFDVGYYVSSGEYISNAIRTYNVREPHPDQQNGSNYSCFYKEIDLTSVYWSLPKEAVFLIELCIGFHLFAAHCAAFLPHDESRSLGTKI
ncbi:unnamed protein product [Rotaria socialis]|uniref:Uncharacterized protein n=1 Tax=Rotaria socialis TaxID=392032 RepID=A0A821BB55_9BILA|nr:unnamed protein product [Rotaria socialis]CAF4416930.1 unnamed protein product [Rotaria socialis]CAF4588216.1 unnamed protein product [Rotaria socialis]